MSAKVIDGRRFARDLNERLRDDVARLSSQGAHPGLGTVRVGDDYPARAYEGRLQQHAEAIGCYYVSEHLPGDVAEADAVAAVGKLGTDPRISGVLILRPLPEHISEVALYRVLDPLKDIEAMHPVNAGLLAMGRPRYVPSTPASAFHLLDRYLAESGRDVDTFYRNANVVVVGRSNNVGKPALHLGFQRHATVVSCDEHSYEAGLLFEHTRHADVVMVAAGVPGLLTGEHVKDGVISIDIGINPVPTDDGKVRLVGDLDFDSVAAKAEAVSPVPGGVGPITDVWLLKNTIAAARLTAEVGAAQQVLEGLTVTADGFGR